MLCSDLSLLKLIFDNDWFVSGFRKHYSVFIVFRVQSKWTATGHKRNEILEMLVSVKLFFIVDIVNRICRLYSGNNTCCLK